MIKVLNEGMHAINIATATSTQDQFIALIIDPNEQKIPKSVGNQA
jgi:hypothetical protein